MTKTFPVKTEPNTILVTGGAGYIGSHTCKALRRAGYRVVAYDNLSLGHEWAVQWGPLEIGDIGDRARLDAVLKKYRPSAIIDCAALTYVIESVAHPLKYYRNNVVGTLTLLEAAKDAGVRTFVFCSTSATYGLPSRVPIREMEPQRPITPYGATSLIVEKMLADFDAAYGMFSIVLRIFNAAGADPECAVGEDHDPETHLLPLVLDVAAGWRRQMTINGIDYPTLDGTCVRDYIHVSDVANAHVLALKALQEGAPSACYNVGTGRGASVREVIRLAERVTGRTISVRPGPRREGDPPELVSAISKIHNELEWIPKYPDLEEILKTGWQWQLKQRGIKESTARGEEEAESLFEEEETESLLQTRLG